MKKLIFIIALLLSTTLTAQAGFFDWLGFGDNVGGGMGTLEMLNQWRSTTDGITTNSSGKTIYAPLSDAYFANLTVGGIATTTTLCFDDNTCQTTAVGALTPWTENIDGGGFNLTNVGYIEADTGTSTISNLNVTGDLTVGANIYGSFTFVTSGELTVDNIKLSGNTISATNDSGVAIYDNASNGIFVKDGGNVGIGTATPDAKLTIEGEGIIIANNSTNNTGKVGYLIGRQYSSDAESEGFSVIGGVGQNGTNRVWIGGNAADNYNAAETIEFLTASNETTRGGTERMRIDNTGNVGIGTTGPITPLDVRNNTTASTLGYALRLGNNTASDLGITGIAFSPYANDNYVKGAMIYKGTDTYYRGDIQFLQNSAANQTNASLGDAVMTIKNDGNVGIGTTAPSEALEINGNLLLDKQGSNSILKFGNTGTLKYMIGYNPTTSLLHFGIDDIGGSTKMVMDTNGNVGIGTTGPVLKMEVAGTTGVPATSGTTPTGIARIHADSGSAVLDIGQDSSSTGSAWLQATNKSDLSTNYPILLNPNGGGVGIGVAAPSAELSVGHTTTAGELGYGLIVGNRVASDLGITGIGFSLYNSQSYNKGAIIYKGTSDGWYRGDIQFLQNTVAGNSAATLDDVVMTIKNNGNVGIGTTAPRVKLDVNGIIYQDGTYGEIHVADGSTAQSIATGVTYTKLTGFTDDGLSNNVTNDVASDQITLTKAGVYRCSSSISGSSGSNNITFKYSVFLNGVEQDQCHNHRKYAASGDMGSSAITGFMRATTTPVTVDLRARHDNGGAVNFIPSYMNLNVEYVGE